MFTIHSSWKVCICLSGYGTSCSRGVERLIVVNWFINLSSCHYHVRKASLLDSAVESTARSHRTSQQAVPKHCSPKLRGNLHTAVHWLRWLVFGFWPSPCLIRGQRVWDLWCTEWRWNRVLSEYLQFSTVSIISPLIHTHASLSLCFSSCHRR